MIAATFWRRYLRAPAFCAEAQPRVLLPRLTVPWKGDDGHHALSYRTHYTLHQGCMSRT